MSRTPSPRRARKRIPYPAEAEAPEILGVAGREFIHALVAQGQGQPRFDDAPHRKPRLPGHIVRALRIFLSGLKATGGV